MRSLHIRISESNLPDCNIFQPNRPCCYLSASLQDTRASIYQWPFELFDHTHIICYIKNAFWTFVYSAEYTSIILLYFTLYLLSFYIIFSSLSHLPILRFCFKFCSFFLSVFPNTFSNRSIYSSFTDFLRLFSSIWPALALSCIALCANLYSFRGILEPPNIRVSVGLPGRDKAGSAYKELKLSYKLITDRGRLIRILRRKM